MINIKKTIYFVVFLVLALFFISSCNPQAKGRFIEDDSAYGEEVKDDSGSSQYSVLLEPLKSVDLSSDTNYPGLIVADTAHLKSDSSNIGLRSVDLRSLNQDKTSSEVWLAAKPGQSCDVLVFYKDANNYNRKALAGEIRLKDY